MRCKNCGWPNQPGESFCTKCHAPLDPGAGESDYQNMPPQNMPDPNLKKTVLDANFMSPAAPTVNQPASMQQPAANSCPQCGFPLRPGSEKCPKCGTPLNGGGNDAFVRRPTVINNQAAPQPVNNAGASFVNFKGNMETVNPYLDGFVAIPACSLKPFKRSNERKQLDNIEFEGENITLNRSNTDPDNATIATESQAVITNENGRWFIVDKSSAKTTFVQAAEKTELTDGSIVLLGNRLFEFHIQ